MSIVQVPKICSTFIIRVDVMNDHSSLIYTEQYAKENFSTQNYWVFGLYPSSNILETRKHNVSETGSISVLRWGADTLCPLQRANLNH
jgi:hypothetical protein